jgi:hypothetical protein
VRPSANDGTDRKSGELERNSSSDRPPSQAAASSEPDASIG